jgi:hypothetical protein
MTSLALEYNLFASASPISRWSAIERLSLCGHWSTSEGDVLPIDAMPHGRHLTLASNRLPSDFYRRFPGLRYIEVWVDASETRPLATQHGNHTPVDCVPASKVSVFPGVGLAGNSSICSANGLAKHDPNAAPCTPRTPCHRSRALARNRNAADQPWSRVFNILPGGLSTRAS